MWSHQIDLPRVEFGWIHKKEHSEIKWKSLAADALEIKQKRLLLLYSSTQL